MLKGALEGQDIGGVQKCYFHGLMIPIVNCFVKWVVVFVYNLFQPKSPKEHLKFLYYGLKLQNPN